MSDQYRTIALLPNGNYGDSSLERILRVIRALGYTPRQVEICRHIDNLHFLELQVPSDEYLDDLDFDPLVIVEKGDDTPAPLPPPPPQSSEPDSTKGDPAGKKSDRICPYCQRSFDTVTLRDAHVRDLHGPDKSHPVFQCDKCPGVWDNHKALAMHRAKAHDGWRKDQPVLACSECEFWCGRVEALGTHTRVAHGRQPTTQERTPLTEERSSGG